MAMKFTLTNPNDFGRGDGANEFDEDEIEWDLDPHTAKKGQVLKTIEYRGYTVVLKQGYGLWTLEGSELPAKLQGRFTGLKDVRKAIDVHLASQEVVDGTDS